MSEGDGGAVVVDAAAVGLMFEVKTLGPRPEVLVGVGDVGTNEFGDFYAYGVDGRTTAVFARGTWTSAIALSPVEGVVDPDFEEVGVR